MRRAPSSWRTSPFGASAIVPRGSPSACSAAIASLPSTRVAPGNVVSEAQPDGASAVLLVGVPTGTTPSPSVCRCAASRIRERRGGVAGSHADDDEPCEPLRGDRRVDRHANRQPSPLGVGEVAEPAGSVVPGIVRRRGGIGRDRRILADRIALDGEERAARSGRCGRRLIGVPERHECVRQQARARGRSSSPIDLHVVGIDADEELRRALRLDEARLEPHREQRDRQPCVDEREVWSDVRHYGINA